MACMERSRRADWEKSRRRRVEKSDEKSRECEEKREEGEGGRMAVRV